MINDIDPLAGRGPWRLSEKGRIRFAHDLAFIIAVLFLEIILIPSFYRSHNNQQVLEDCLSYCDLYYKENGYKKLAKPAQVYKDYHEEFVVDHIKREYGKDIKLLGIYKGTYGSVDNSLAIRYNIFFRDKHNMYCIVIKDNLAKSNIEKAQEAFRQPLKKLIL